MMPSMMPGGSTAMTPCRDRHIDRGPPSLAVASSLSLVLHGAALCCVLWLHDWTPAQPIKVISVQLVGPLDSTEDSGERTKTASSFGEAPGAPTLDSALDHVIETAPDDIETSSHSARAPTPGSGNQPRESHDLAPPSPAASTEQPIVSQSLGPVPNEAGNDGIMEGATVAHEASPVRTVPHPPPPPDKPLVPASRQRIEVGDREPADASIGELRLQPTHSTGRPPVFGPIQANSDAMGDDGRTRRTHETTGLGEALAALAQGGTDGNENDARDGHGVGPRFAGRGLSNPPPRYPFAARRRGLEGRLVLRVRVSAAGDAESVSVIRSSGYRVLDMAAVRAIEKWHFLPADRAGKAVAGLIDVPVTFQLEN
jgi:protein TonB